MLETMDDRSLYRLLDTLPLEPFTRNERWAVESETAGIHPGVLLLRLEWASMAAGLMYLYQDTTHLIILVAKVAGERRGFLRRQGPPRYWMMIGTQDDEWVEGPVVDSFEEVVAVVNKLASPIQP